MATISGAAELIPVVLANNADWSEAHALVQADGETTYALPAGCRAAMEVRAAAAAEGVALRSSTENGELSFAPPEGDDPYWWLVHHVAARPRMARIEPGEYVCDYLILTQDGETIYGGRRAVTIVSGITRIPT